MQPTKEQDSFEQYKKYLQDSLGITGIVAPPKPMNPFSRFCFQRKWEQKSKSNVKTNFTQFMRACGEQWKNLDEKKKQYYQKIYEVRARQKDQLQQQYQLLTKKPKIITGYTLYVKRKFQQINNKNNSLSTNQINKLVTSQWKKLNNSQRQKYNKQATLQKQRHQLTTQQRQQRVQTYVENIKKFQAQLKQQRDKILKKYGISNKRQTKKLQRQNKRQQQKQQKLRRKNQQKQRKQKQKQQKSKKLNENEKNIKRPIKREGTVKQQKAAIKRQLAALNKQPSLKDKRHQAQVKIQVKQEYQPIRQTRSRAHCKQ